MSGNEATLRAFIAVELPDAVKAFLMEIADQLKRAGGDVKWVRPEGVHLTLKFLGDTERAMIPALQKDLAAVFATQVAFSVRVEGLGAFPNLGKPRVIWAGLHDPTGALGPLAARIDAVTESFGFPQEKRAFNPHLTLGRVRSDRGKGPLADAVRERMELSGPGFPADHAALFQSVLKPSGAEYLSLCRFDFSRD